MRRLSSPITAVLAAVSTLVGAGAVALTSVVAVVATAPPSAALENGLARIPPMGFNNWNTTECRAVFHEAMVKGVADAFVASGLKDAGYTYVNIDDCWAEPQRNSAGNLVPNRTRFPNGIKAVADYVHSKGLKFGLYTSAGTKTCNRDGGFPGGLDHEQQDANLFASWGVDYLKYDNCNNQGRDAVQRYTKMRDALKATGRPIVYSICEWGRSDPKVWTWGANVGNLWRTTGDISDNWSRMVSLLKQNEKLAQYAGPGHWNDPDMLEVGNGGMTTTEYRTHFSLWAIMAAPLLIGTDLRKATPETMSILLNSDVIAVDQDPLGVQGTPVRAQDGLYVLVKPLAGGDRAVALFNSTDRPATISATATEVGLSEAPAYRIRDLWTDTTRETAGVIRAGVPAHGTALFRVGVDRWWPLYPPAVDLAVEPELAYPGATPIAMPGRPLTVTSTVLNSGRLPALLPRVDLAVPEGWTARATSPRLTPLLGRDRSFRTTWAVTAPGRPLTIGGVVYAKGLGAHAPGTIEYYAGGNCSAVRAAVGVDDEKDPNGSVAFQIWADGVKVADSGVLTNTMPAASLQADVSGATLVRLVTTDGGDGMNSDHADWADAQLTCS